ncbi:hypothetical protein M0802_009615 [Mischocyttarus mexicanus]|nr:hypothetical protein M0802_009615 [Mischocyttarus mexicanus]
MSFRRKVRDRISSSSGSDIDESYASEDIEELLTELGLDEEEKLNTANDSLNNIQFKMQLKILFNLNKKSVTHIWVTWVLRKHARNPSTGYADKALRLYLQ